MIIYMDVVNEIEILEHNAQVQRGRRQSRVWIVLMDQASWFGAQQTKLMCQIVFQYSFTYSPQYHSTKIQCPYFSACCLMPLSQDVCDTFCVWLVGHRQGSAQRQLKFESMELREENHWPPRLCIKRGNPCASLSGQRHNIKWSGLRVSHDPWSRS